MTRRSREAVLMDTAHVFASRSTCSRGQVGAVIARDGRIIVTGYNGAPAGLPHCNHDCTCESETWEPGERYGDDGLDHHPQCPMDNQGCTTATHAEANAVAFAARHGVATEGADLYVTMVPCVACARIVVNAGLSTVYYDSPYRDMSGAQLLRTAGVDVYDVNLRTWMKV